MVLVCDCMQIIAKPHGIDADNLSNLSFPPSSLLICVKSETGRKLQFWTNV